VSAPLRRVEVARVAYSLAMLAVPRRLQRLLGVPADRTGTVVVRVLGARQLVQGLASGLSPSPEVLAMGVWVDLAHASTGLGLAAVDRSRARAGLIDAALAAGWAAAGLWDLGTVRATPPAHDRRRDELARTVLRHAPGGGWLLAQAHAARRRGARRRLHTV